MDNKLETENAQLRAELGAVKRENATWTAAVANGNKLMTQLRATNARLEAEKQNEKDSLASLRSRCVNKPCHGPDNLLGEWEDGQIHCWECEWYALEKQLSESRATNARLRAALENCILRGESGKILGVDNEMIRKALSSSASEDLACIRREGA